MVQMNGRGERNDTLTCSFEKERGEARRRRELQ